METANFAEIWDLFRSEAEEREKYLVAEYRAIWKDTGTLLQAAGSAAAADSDPAIDRSTVSSLREFLEGAGSRLALEFIREFKRLRPQERALSALEVYEAGLEDVARRVPAMIALPAEELIGALGEENISALRGYLLRRRGKLELPLGAILESHLLEEAHRRARLDGEFLLCLAKASLALLTPWQDLRRSTLRAFADAEAGESDFAGCMKRWTAQVKELEGAAARVFEGLESASGKTAVRAAHAVQRGKPRVAGGRLQEWKRDRQEQFGYWSRQRRAVAAVVELELHLHQLASSILQAAATAMEALDTEHAALLAELDAAIRWLEAAQTAEVSSGFPPPAAKLFSAGDHAGAWRQSAEAAGREFLAADIESVEPRRALPSARPPWRNLQPLRSYLAELKNTGYPIVLEGFRQAEAEHRSIVREIERSREVVNFSLETGLEETGESTAIEEEGLANALGLVTYKRNTITPPRAVVERHFVEGIAMVLLSATARLEQGRLGFLTHLARQSGTRALRTGRQLLQRELAAGGRWLSSAVRERYHWFLLKTGWETPPTASYAPVVVWEYLGDVMDLHPGSRNLPLIYRRLFRLAPVEDPRFLVARDEEFAAFGHARQLWEANRSVAVLLTGSRGSGKTSLLNCAVTGEFSEVPVIRNQFHDRISSRESMQAFLRNLFEAPEGDDLVEWLSGRRHVVVLEELERTFLRRLNGFDGIRELLLTISLTSRSTLWILSLNDHCFRYLDAAVGLSRFFSHRINAMAISPANLKEAILLRHNLSGLRLRYPVVRGGDPRINRFRKFLGLEQNVEELFFDSLYQQSQGIFRSAFELWQHYIDRVEGGVLYLRQPIAPEPEPLIAQFTQDDAFTLQAILQHGSLTIQDHSEVFDCPAERSRIVLERLVGLECLEDDPVGEGLRVRPEAGRIVYTALHRVNLL